MNKEVLINAGAAESRIAVLEDGRLQDLFFERLIPGDDDTLPSQRSGGPGHRLIGSIILGRVQRVLPAMQAAFVAIGSGRAGFLGAREARCLAGVPSGDEQYTPNISECVREGDDVLVQVIKDPIGDKGARLSANIALAGRLLVLLPHRPGIALSRRIDNQAERERLTALCNTMVMDGSAILTADGGYIVRSAAVGGGLSELREDAERLSETWRGITEQRQSARAPSTLYQDLDPVERTLRDHVDADTIRVLIDDVAAFEVARAYCRLAMPAAENRLELFTGPGALFASRGLEDEIEELMEPHITLPSGGWITIEATEALTAIDVNSGSFTGATGLEETSLVINLEAAAEIPRQLRLRGIGGLIVVDFIQLRETLSVEHVLEILTQALARDRVPAQISRMSEFGLVEIARKRARDPMLKPFTETCDACCGRGRRRTQESVALDIIRNVERTAAAAPGKAIKVLAAPDVVRWLTVHDAKVRSSLARRGAPRVAFLARDEFERQGYEITTD